MIYQIQQTSSECPQCSHIKSKNNISLSSSRQSSSSEQQVQQQSSNHRYVIPIRKNMMKNNQYIEQTLNILQGEVQKLKQQNFLKERKIRKLQAELLKRQYRLYPQNAKVGSIYENQFDIPKKTLSKRTLTQSDLPQIQYERKHRKTKQKASRALFQIDEIEKKIKEISENKNQRIQFLEDQLNLIQLENDQLQQKLEEQINDNQWLTKFCLSFINMAAQVSKAQGKQFVQPNASLRKNTKLAWRYFKAFVKEVIQ